MFKTNKKGPLLSPQLVVKLGYSVFDGFRLEMTKKWSPSMSRQIDMHLISSVQKA